MLVDIAVHPIATENGTYDGIDSRWAFMYWDVLHTDETDRIAIVARSEKRSENSCFRHSTSVQSISNESSVR